jgi:hypothetical protein
MTAQILYCHPPQNQPPTKHSADDTDSHLSLKTKPINLCSELCSSGHHQTFLLICEFNFGVKGKFYTNDNQFQPMRGIEFITGQIVFNPAYTLILQTKAILVNQVAGYLIYKNIMSQNSISLFTFCPQTSPI